MLVTVYYLYFAEFIVWTIMLFGNTLPYGANNTFYMTFFFIEFYGLIFVRTQKSIAYFPKIAFVLIVGFLIYRMNHVYPFMNAAAYVVICFAVSAMAYASIQWEKKVYFSEGPSFLSPRMMYQPVFSQYSPSFPELWGTFYPVEPQGYFTEEELTLRLGRGGVNT